MTTAITEAMAASDFQHSGLVGNARELVVEKLLHPVLPPEIHIGTGKLVDSIGTISPQIDIVLYSRHIIPLSCMTLGRASSLSSAVCMQSR